MSGLDHCEHGRKKPGYCPHCERDIKRGKAWAKQEMKNDPGTQKAVVDIAKEMLYNQRSALCREAVLAALQDRKRIERSLAEGTGVWWKELGPLSPQERAIVVNQLKLTWDVRAGEVPIDPDAQLKAMVGDQIGDALADGLTAGKNGKLH